MRPRCNLFILTFIHLLGFLGACPGSLYNGIQWYALLTKSALIKVDPNTPFTGSTLYDHVSSDTTFPPDVVLISNLVPSVTPCGSCALNFVNDLLSLRVAGTLDNSCFQSGVTWSVTDTTDILAPNCAGSLSTALDSFNRCSDSTYSLLTGLPVSTQCSYGDFLDIDAQYHSFGIMMNYALSLSSTIPYLAEFQTAISTSTCGACFFNFIKTISAIKSDFFVKSACADIYSVGCQTLQPVRDALVRFRNCVGGYDLTNMNARPSMCTPNEKLLITKAYNFYAPIVTCSLTNNPRGSPSSLAAWTTCMQSSKRELSSLFSLTCRDCLLDFGSFVNSNGSPSCSTIGPYSSACIASTTSARNTLYICSGFEMNVSPPTVCPAVYFANLQPKYHSYIPMMESAVLAGSSLDKAVGFFFNQTMNSPLVNATANLPCQSCFASLAADLAYAFSIAPTILTTDCASFYSDQCFTSPAVTNALNDFLTCSGFPLDNTSPYTCSKSEVEAIQLSNIPKNMFYGIFRLGSKLYKLDEVLNNMHAAFLSLRGASPAGSNSYMCSRCFEQLFTDMENVDLLTGNICKSVDNVPICFYKLSFQLTRFQDCAGFDFDFSQPPVNQVSLIVPVINTTTDTSNNTTGLKDGEALAKNSQTSSSVFLITLAYLILVA